MPFDKRDPWVTLYSVQFSPHFMHAHTSLAHTPRETWRPASRGDVFRWRTHTSRLFFVTDKHSGTRFLIDTGAEVSVFPARETDKHHASYSPISLTLDLGLCRTFRWVFLLTIGADCLRHFDY